MNSNTNLNVILIGSIVVGNAANAVAKPTKDAPKVTESEEKQVQEEVREEQEQTAKPAEEKKQKLVVKVGPLGRIIGVVCVALLLHKLLKGKCCEEDCE